MVLVDAINRPRKMRPIRAMVFVEETVLATITRASRKKSTALFFSPIRACKIKLAALPQILAWRAKGRSKMIFNARQKTFAARMLAAHLSRHSYVVIVGGGALLDAVGFAASLVHRGLRQVRIPTTVLSQNDGGVGVKNGVNFAGQKNALGVFAPPFAVINDFEFLKTLGERQWLDGVAEAFKVSIIRDKPFFEFLVTNAVKLKERDPAAMRHLIFRCAELHLEHIRSGGDPFEFGHARPLDFGHWSAHKLETMSGFKISHGEAVAAGVLLDSLYAVGKGWLARAEFDAIHAAFLASGLPVWLDELETPGGTTSHLKIFDGIAEFQEHLGVKLCITFPQGIGSRHEVHEIDLAGNGRGHHRGIKKTSREILKLPAAARQPLRIEGDSQGGVFRIGPASGDARDCFLQDQFAFGNVGARLPELSAVTKPSDLSYLCALPERQEKSEGGPVAHFRIPPPPPPPPPLHFMELIGGWPAAFIAQRRLRHKISKRSYQVNYWLIIAAYQFIAFDFLFNWMICKAMLAFIQKKFA